MNAPDESRGRRRFIGLALFVATVLLYADVREFGFVDYDDRLYVVDNPHVAEGLTLGSIGWALTSTSYACNWHPLTWMSHMLDVELFGLDAGPHHVHGLLLHAATAALLFWALASMTGAVWRPALVAALFAWHPVRVESVAWVAERKDVLAGLFAVLTLLAYTRWTRAPSAGRYACIVAALALGLMAKPMLVTLPFLLLLFDRWPLERSESLGTLVQEKIPLFLASAASCALTFRAQSEGGCTEFISEGVATGSRIGNAAVAYLQYLTSTLWPTRLSVFYPHPAVVTPDATRTLAYAVSGSVLAGVTLGAFALRRRVPAFAVGWLWFIGMLVPVLGVVQVGGQARADRYAYLPLIGVYVAAAWCLGALVRRRPALRRPIVALSLVACAGCIALTQRQIEVWRDTRSLFEHALRVTQRNYVAHTNLGLLELRAEAPDLAAARNHFERAVRFAPSSFEAQVNLGWMLAISGEPDDALRHLTRAIEIRPNDPNARFRRGLVLEDLGRLDEALDEVLEARRLLPDHPEIVETLERLEERRSRGD